MAVTQDLMESGDLPENCSASGLIGFRNKMIIDVESTVKLIGQTLKEEIKTYGRGQLETIFRPFYKDFLANSNDRRLQH